MEKAIDAKEVAELLGFSRGHILKMAKHGEIPHRRIGKSVKFRKSEIDAWWNQRDDEASNHSRPNERTA